MRTRPILVVAAVSAVLVLIPAIASGQDAFARQRLSMDHGWRFTTGDPAGAEAPRFDDSGWRTVDVPHDWSIEGAYDSAAATTGRGGYLPTGVGWYRRTFTLPRGARDGRVWLEFDGVYQNSDVWLNGRHVGHRPYGYASFMYDVTDALVDGRNVVAVRVDNSRQPNSRWYTGSGIYRHVWLTTVGPVHVAHWGTFVTALAAATDSAVIGIATRIENRNATRRTVMLRNEVFDARSRLVSSREGPLPLTADGAEVTHLVRLDTPALWSPETPSMYTLRQTLLLDGRAIDIVETPFGIRSAVFDADRGFLLNGERVKLLGVNLHHDGGPVGAAVPLAVWERRFRLLREMGANAIRTAHNPMAPEFMDLADREGFLVMDEVFDEWTHGKVEHGYHEYFDEWHERDLVDFIRRDRNHPSVVLWSLGNEIGEQHAPGGDTILARLRAITLREDGTRPITTGNDHIYADDGATTEAFLELLDVVGYNYVDRWHERREHFAWPDRMSHPDRPRVGTENVAIRGDRGDYDLGGDPARPDPNWVSDMLRAEKLWRFVALNDWFSGDFMWTGIDYLGETGWPRVTFGPGPLDIVGFPTDAYFFYQSQWTDSPVLHLFPHWNWEDREGQSIPVLAYTNVDAVELWLNDRFIGERRLEFPQEGTSGCWNCYEGGRPVAVTTNDLHVAWDVPYEPGVLRAVGKNDGTVVITTEVRTAGPPAALRLSVDRDTIDAGERDVAHVRVEVVDANGTVVPNASNRIRFEVTGAGRLLAVGNGDPRDHDPYQADSRRAFHGLALAFIEAGEQPGPIRVTARADGLRAASVEVVVRRGQSVARVPR